jgi:hypothetical protein
MPIFVSQLEKAVIDAVKGIQNARVELLKGLIPTEVDEVQFQVEMIRDDGQGAFALKSITATPKRVSRSETPEVVEESEQTVGGSSSTSDDTSSQSSNQTASETSSQTTNHGRNTQVDVTYKD